MIARGVKFLLVPEFPRESLSPSGYQWPSGVLLTGSLPEIKHLRRTVPVRDPYEWNFFGRAEPPILKVGTETMMPTLQRRTFPEPSLSVFFALQALDVLTTMLGLHAGAHEGSLFISKLMQIGPLPALLVVKLFASALVLGAFATKRSRVVVFLNFWFAAVVTWNLGIILTALFSFARP